MFPYLLFISAVSLLSGVLNSVEKFAAAAFSPVILNICMISGVLLLGHYTDTPAHALAIGVVVSGVLQLLWLIYACYKSGVVVRLKKFTFNHDTKILYKKMVPWIIGAGVVQINMLIDTILATFIPKGVSYLYYADRINQLPMAVIGTAMGIVLLPTMSAYLKKGKIDEANKIQNNAIEFSMLLTIPAAAALITVGLPMLSVMFERGEFSYDDAYNTSLALCAYAVGLPAFVLIKIFVPTFFANSDTSTPVKIAMKCVVINLILNFALFIPLQHVGLALATSISAWVNALLLGKALHKQKLIKIDKKLYKLITKMLGAAILMAAILYEYKYFAHDYIYDNELYIEIASIVVLIVVGTIAYFAGCKLFRVSTVNNLGRFTRKNR
jgi:putative peptidoglycan lipid II flippase